MIALAITTVTLVLVGAINQQAEGVIDFELPTL